VTVRETDTIRIARLRNALEITSEKLERISGDIADGFTALALAQRVKFLDDFVKAVLAADELDGGRR
jgi:hypothetical protein